MKKIVGIPSCKECPLRVSREVICDDMVVKLKSYCVGSPEPFHPQYSYFIRLNSISVIGMELSDLEIIHPDCPLEDDIVVKEGDIE